MRCRLPIRLFHPMLAAIAGAGTSPVSASELLLKVVDADTGKPAPARVHVRDEVNKDYVSAGAQVVRIGRSDRWFVTGGESRLDVPAGTVQVRVERGTEYEPVKQAIRVAGEGATERVFRLKRWINMRKHGYVCGENHLHVPADEIAPQLAAEGLDFGTSLQWWNRPRYEVPPGTGFLRCLEFAGIRTPTSIYDFEIEHLWGAVYVIGMPEPLDCESNRSQANLPIVRMAREAGALVCYQGGWSREVLPDALLGFVDVVNVCNNNFHRHQYQPRTEYSNLLNVEGFPAYPNTPEGMMRMNTDTYYRLLNCGLRLAAGAGSATGAKNTPVGYNRAYVRAGPNPTLPEFLDAWRRGRNFVTCGPMVFLTIDEKHRPGDTIALGHQGGKVRIHVEAFSDQPITSVEIVINGKTFSQTRSPRDKDDPPSKATLSTTVEISEGSWIAARCTDEDRLLRDEEFANHSYGKEPKVRRPCRLRFAHTSPVYVTIDGRRARVATSIEEARRMLDAFGRFARARAKGRHLQEVLTALAAARQRLCRPEAHHGNIRAETKQKS